MYNLITSSRNGDSEEQELKDFIEVITKKFADILDIPYDLIKKTYEKEKKKCKRF